MSLLVVPLARHESELLTLHEWDALLRRSRVWFERPDHPLVERLRQAGVAAGELDDEPQADDSGSALVAEPGSGRVVELARSGAVVTAGVARPPDPLTAAHAAPLVRRASAALGGLAAIMARLRSDDGCPWDREQSHRSLTIHLLEETYEVIDTIESDGADPHFAEELGDLLLQVAFHARLAEQASRFDLADVADRIVAKLVHRHPHVFGDVVVAGADEVLHNWEQLKAAEKQRGGAFDDIPAALPALLAASKTQKRARGLGFETPESEARRRAAEALESDRFGAALFWVVALARAHAVDPEAALRHETRLFRERFEPG
jgi:XTP/dITP diphosphohydrolase